MSIRVDERPGIVWINEKTCKRIPTQILFEGQKEPVLLFKKGTKSEITDYLNTMFPNVIPVLGWVWNYELDNVLLFDERSDAQYSKANRFPA